MTPDYLERPTQKDSRRLRIKLATSFLRHFTANGCFRLYARAGQPWLVAGRNMQVFPIHYFNSNHLSESFSERRLVSVSLTDVTFCFRSRRRRLLSLCAGPLPL